MSNSIAVILPAAGRAIRFGRDKLLETLDGKTVIQRALEPFLARSDVRQVLIATENAEGIRAGLGSIPDPRIAFCTGGETRAHSVRNALVQVSDTIGWIAVHDAARPLLDNNLIDRTLAAAKQFGAAAPALPVNLTVKQAAGPLPAKVQRTAPRHDLWTMQTPQIMRRTDLQTAFDRCPIPLDQVTDDVQLLELIGLPVYLVEGNERNLKITTRQDLSLAELLFRSKK